MNTKRKLRAAWAVPLALLFSTTAVIANEPTISSVAQLEEHLSTVNRDLDNSIHNLEHELGVVNWVKKKYALFLKEFEQHMESLMEAESQETAPSTTSITLPQENPS